MSGDAYSTAQVSSLRLKTGKDSKLKQKKKNRAREALETAEATVAREGNKNQQEDTRTDAQKAFDVIQERRQAERILKKAEKTHKQRVEELNAQLEGQTEHYDIPKVSWTK
ncbi:FAM32A-like [Oopsacas minuta]|uniref:FAM32A-like n=1 Tax=Oopsacas minuta TaxID=111878 RepID=A0AAV7IXD7_9METZ|nr:FAM32A-like [Oopsacas minuta]